MRPVRRYCCCGTLLARDNAAGLCGACQRVRRRDRAPDVPPEFWQTEAMATALDSGDLGRVVRAYRSHPFHGQPLPQCTLAGWLHISRATLSRIEQGRRRLTVDEIAGYAHERCARRRGFPRGARRAVTVAARCGHGGRLRPAPVHVVIGAAVWPRYPAASRR